MREVGGGSTNLALQAARSVDGRQVEGRLQWPSPDDAMRAICGSL